MLGFSPEPALVPQGHPSRSSAELGVECRSEREDLFFSFLSTLENKIED